jgi:hypothetical protein
VAEGDDRIDAHGSVRWNIRRGQCYDGEENGYAGEGERVVRADSIKHFLQQARQAKRCGGADKDTEHCRPCALPQHKPQDIAALSTESDAQSNFMCTLAHHKRSDTVDPNAREQQFWGSEDPE